MSPMAVRSMSQPRTMAVEDAAHEDRRHIEHKVVVLVRVAKVLV